MGDPEEDFRAAKPLIVVVIVLFIIAFWRIGTKEDGPEALRTDAEMVETAQAAP